MAIKASKVDKKIILLTTWRNNELIDNIIFDSILCSLFRLNRRIFSILKSLEFINLIVSVLSSKDFGKIENDQRILGKGNGD